MENKLLGLVDKRVDLFCSSSIVFRGKLEAVENGIVRVVDDEGRVFFVDVEKIVAASEAVDSASRPGFRS
ncbi:MAG: MM0924 family protein [Pyrinomonadaceae bacterium]